MHSHQRIMFVSVCLVLAAFPVQAQVAPTFSGKFLTETRFHAAVTPTEKESSTQFVADAKEDSNAFTAVLACILMWCSAEAGRRRSKFALMCAAFSALAICSCAGAGSSGVSTGNNGTGGNSGDPPSGSPAGTPITVGAADCGATALQDLNCYSVPLTIGDVSGTAWFLPQFILFRPSLEGANYVEAQITSTTILATNNLGQATQVRMAFTIPAPSLNGSSADPDGNSDSDAVRGQMTLGASYRWGCNSGRSGGCRYVLSVTGGSGAQSIAQD